jgi:hypothetical protein
MGWANLTAPIQDGRRDGDITSFKMAAELIYKGSLVYVDTNGYATIVAGAGFAFLGAAYETVDNSGGSAGDLNIRVWHTGVFPYSIASAAQTNVAEVVWGSIAGNPGTVLNSDPGAAAKVGVIAEVESSTKVWVRIDGYAMSYMVEGS